MQTFFEGKGVVPILQAAHCVLVALLRYDVLCRRLLHQHYSRALLQATKC